MKGKWLVFLFSVLILTLLVGCQTAGEAYLATREVEVGQPANATEPDTGEQVTAQEPGPAAVVQDFYDWYLAYIGDRSEGEFNNPLVDGAYKQSVYLSPGFITEVDETLASFDKGGFDPFLQAQDVPESIVVEGEEIAGEEAMVTALRYWGGNPDPSSLTVQLQNLADGWQITGITAEPPAAEAPANPAAVAQSFYDWYIAYLGDDRSRMEHNPLVDGAYKDSDLLSAAFISQVEAKLDGFDPHGFDPILMARYVPESMVAVAFEEQGDEALVVLERSWPSFATSLPLEVKLIREDGRWLINGLSLISGDDVPPAKTVQDFYTWYLRYIGNLAGEMPRNPMVDGVYRESPYLAPAFVQEVDELLASFEGGGYDPFLCAQDIPASFVVDGTVVTPAGGPDGGAQASVLVRTTFHGHNLLVDLEQAGEGWLITGINCGFDPAARVRAFYTWYLGYIGDRSDGTFRNPLVDGAYQNSSFLSPDFIAEVDEALASFEQGGFDPFLLAQDIPQGFEVAPGPAENTALVTFYFYDQEGQPYGQWQAQVTLEQGQGRWLISDIEPVDAAGQHPAAGPDAEVIAAGDYGFSFAVPAGWVAQPVQMGGPGMPDDWPVVQMWQVMPVAVAEQMAAQSGPPDPQAPPIVPPFSVEVVAGDQAAFDRVYVTAAATETATYGDKSVTVQQEQPGVTRYVMRHPNDPELWIVVIDWVTGFPGREGLAEAAAPVLPSLLASFEF
jgi:hypothetical protein